MFLHDFHCYKFNFFEFNEKNRFGKWLSNYIYYMKGAQRELYDRSHMKKSDCEKTAAMFIWLYGWKLEEESVY